MVLNGFVALVAAQLAGETLARLLSLPIPGPVIGLGLSVIVLIWRPALVSGAIGQAADALLRHLALLFVPAGVGVLQYGGLLARDGARIAAVLVLSTALTLAITAMTFVWLTRTPGDAP